MGSDHPREQSQAFCVKALVPKEGKKGKAFMCVELRDLNAREERQRIGSGGRVRGPCAPRWDIECRPAPWDWTERRCLE